MKKAFLLLFFFASFCSLSWGQGVRIMESLSMYSKILGQEVKYSICLPQGYFKSNKKYPVVYLLHGLGDNESSWLEYGQISQVADKAVKSGEIIPMIYVMPQGFRSYYVNNYSGTFRYQDMFTKELIPFIDSAYHGIADKKSRATLGYSMGGFGALVLPLKYPNLFTACVPLSVSIRTEKQYMEEEGKDWDEQWGRIFGGEGTKGAARITDYYQQNCPLPMIAQQESSQWKNLRIYIDCGDDEQTLAFSNEELHYILRDKQIAHEYRVRNGGHEFSYWREALPNGLRFISDAFQGKPYRGDMENTALKMKTAGVSLLKGVKIGDGSYPAYFPEEFNYTSRLYPVIYVLGDMSQSEQERMTVIANNLISKNDLPPFLIVFLPGNEKRFQELIIPEIENKYKGRQGFRFRSLVLIGKGGTALQYALKPEQFTSCAMIDPSPNFEIFQTMINGIDVKSIERTWFFVGTNEKSPNYKTNGSLHLLFREMDIYHEYRVVEGANKNDWKSELFKNVLQFTSKKIHR